MAGVTAARLCGLRPAPCLPAGVRDTDIQHDDAIHRADRQAALAPCAQVLDHRVQRLRSTDDAVDRTSIEAQRAADACSFVDAGQPQFAFNPMNGIDSDDRGASDHGQASYALGAAGGALINAGLLVGDRLRVVAAIRETATRALRLRQRVVDSFDQASAGFHPRDYRFAVARRLACGAAARVRLAVLV